MTNNNNFLKDYNDINNYLKKNKNNNIDYKFIFNKINKYNDKLISNNNILLKNKLLKKIISLYNLRYKLLLGEIMAGNNNPLLIKEFNNLYS